MQIPSNDTGDARAIGTMTYLFSTLQPIRPFPAVIQLNVRRRFQFEVPSEIPEGFVLVSSRSFLSTKLRLGTDPLLMVKNFDRKSP